MPHEAALVLRGHQLDPVAPVGTAQENFDTYGFYCTSVFVEVNGTDWRTIAAPKLVRAGWLAIFTAGDLLVAKEPGTVLAGAVLRAETERFWSWVRIDAVDADGQVHFHQIPADEARKAGAVVAAG